MEREMEGDGGDLNVGGDTVGAVVEDGVLRVVEEEAREGHPLFLTGREIDLKWK